jgi:hypothetical protein
MKILSRVTSYVYRYITRIVFTLKPDYDWDTDLSKTKSAAARRLLAIRTKGAGQIEGSWMAHTMNFLATRTTSGNVVIMAAFLKDVIDRINAEEGGMTVPVISMNTVPNDRGIYKITDTKVGQVRVRDGKYDRDALFGFTKSRNQKAKQASTGDKLASGMDLEDEDDEGFAAQTAAALEDAARINRARAAQGPQAEWVSDDEGEEGEVGEKKSSD